MGSTFFNRLSPAELERLSILSEECNEVSQMVNKIIRHGYESFHPEDASMSNRKLLQTELGHLQCAQDFLTESQDLNWAAIDASRKDKRQRIRPYLHHHVIEDE